MSEDAYKKAFERERNARKEAERITELKSRELFELNSALKLLNDELELRIKERTSELEKARNRAEANTKAKSEFLSMMSHEMRSPLNVIVGLTELLDQRELKEPEGGYVRNVRFSALQLLNLINDILDLSAIEAGKIVFESTPFDVTYAVDQVFKALEQRAIDKGLTWAKSVPDNLPVPLQGDASKLNQVLINLLDNAIKFTRDGGVELSLDQLQNRGNEGEVWIAVEVTDSGKGISEENMDRIFGKFEQENTSTRRVHGGSGLGLAISKQLIELQGGSISCSSEVGKGTTFRVELPFRYEGRVSEDVGARDWSQVNLVGLRLLVVEDLEVNRMLLRQMLRNKGIVMFEAENGKESLEVLKEHDVDLILMDLHMPEMDGIEATQRIREGRVRRVNAEIPIVCLTADVFKETKEAIFSAGMNDFVTKPLEMRRLYQVLSHWRKQIDARNAALS
jgi:signal transduction histidine kinase/ActR/RegA family two-component response regulator